MSDSTDLGVIRGEPDLAEAFRRHLYDVIHAAVRIGQGHLSMTHSQMSVWVAAQLDELTRAWKTAGQLRGADTTPEVLADGPEPKGRGKRKAD